MKTAFIFPGQGSQFVGMGKDLADQGQWFDRASDVLGYDLKTICFEGPEEVLKQTSHAQPAILTCSMAMLAQTEGEPDVVAGHSLGEYSSLVAAGVIRFEDAVKLVHVRGKLMEKAVPGGEGAMGAVMGLEETLLSEICNNDKGLVEFANINTAEQIVISGEAPAVKRVCEQAEKAGAKRTVLLAVSGPFHSSLMKPMAQAFEEELNRVSFNDAQLPVVCNVRADFVQDADDIKQLLIKQLYSPVLWRQSVEKMVESGVTDFKEVGPGNVLTGLVRRITKEMCVNVIKR